MFVRMDRPNVLWRAPLPGIDENPFRPLPDEVRARAIQRPHARIQRHHPNHALAQLRHALIDPLAEFVFRVRL